MKEKEKEALIRTITMWQRIGRHNRRKWTVDPGTENEDFRLDLIKEKIDPTITNVANCCYLCPYYGRAGGRDCLDCPLLTPSSLMTTLAGKPPMLTCYNGEHPYQIIVNKKGLDQVDFVKNCKWIVNRCKERLTKLGTKEE